MFPGVNVAVRRDILSHPRSRPPSLVDPRPPLTTTTRLTRAQLLFFPLLPPVPPVLMAQRRLYKILLLLLMNFPTPRGVAPRPVVAAVDVLTWQLTDDIQSERMRRGGDPGSELRYATTRLCRGARVELTRLRVGLPLYKNELQNFLLKNIPRPPKRKNENQKTPGQNRGPPD